MINWFKQKVIQWVREDWENSSLRTNDNDKVPFPDRHGSSGAFGWQAAGLSFARRIEPVVRTDDRGLATRS